MQYLGRNRQTKLIDKVGCLWVKVVGLTWTQHLFKKYYNNNKITEIMNYNDLQTL